MKYFFIILTLLFTINLYSSSIKLDIIIEENVLRDYKKFIQNKSVLNIDKFKYNNSRRSVVELILFQQALFLGGNYKVKLNFINSPTYLRELQQLKQAKGISTATSLWLNDLNNLKQFVYISDPLIRNNEFEVGFYTIASNKKALSAKSLKDIQQLTAVSNKYWVPDWKTLERINPRKIIHEIKWKYMTRIVSVKRGDFLFAPFQITQDLSFKTENIKFIPIHGIKTGLQGTRHFAIAKKYPNSKEIFEALNKGIKLLRKKGIIEKAYKQSGFFNEKVKDWTKL